MESCLTKWLIQIFQDATRCSKIVFNNKKKNLLKCYLLQILCDSQHVRDDMKLLSLSMPKLVLYQHLPEVHALRLKHCFLLLIFVTPCTINVSPFFLNHRSLEPFTKMCAHLKQQNWINPFVIIIFMFQNIEVGQYNESSHCLVIK